jgi:hypothetical protein
MCNLFESQKSNDKSNKYNIKPYGSTIYDNSDVTFTVISDMY